MAALHVIVVWFLCSTLVNGDHLHQHDEYRLTWPTEYHFKGENIYFMLILKEPFEVWYSSNLNRSRIDYYDGTVRNWYYGDTGYAYTLHPVTMDVGTTDLCFKTLMKTGLTDYLPHTSLFKHTGQKTSIYDKAVEIWTSRQVYGDGIETYVWETMLYVYTNKTGIHLPVHQESRLFNKWSGKVINHVIINYFDFRDNITIDELTIDNVPEEKCITQPPGENFKSDLKFFHPNIPIELDMAFESYTEHHNKQYQDEEQLKRKKIFEKNWRMVEDHNRKNSSFKLELNKFSDKTIEELQYLKGTYKLNMDLELMPFPYTEEEAEELVEFLPKNLDLRIEGIVNPVKDQGYDCGSCWAFSTTVAIEGAIARARRRRLVLSEQALVDCSWSVGNNGCRNGRQDYALQYVLKHGIPTEEDYGPYYGFDGKCATENVTMHRIRGFGVVPPKPSMLKLALHLYGPIATTIYVSDQMLHYSRGLYYDSSCKYKKANHGVAIIGYGVLDGEEYWLVKDSHGEDWGLKGYIALSIDYNHCLFQHPLYYVYAQ